MYTLVGAVIRACFAPGVHVELATRSSIAWQGRDQPKYGFEGMAWMGVRLCCILAAYLLGSQCCR